MTRLSCIKLIHEYIGINSEAQCYDTTPLSLSLLLLMVWLIEVDPNTTFVTISARDKITTIAITNPLGQTVYNQQYNS